jgi:hypothetical protein
VGLPLIRSGIGIEKGMGGDSTGDGGHRPPSGGW